MNRTNRSTIVLLAVALLCSLLTAAAQDRETRTIFVAPSGDDRNPGTEAQPLRSFKRAQAAVRQLKKEVGDRADIAVVLRGGEYPVEEAILFTSEDSGIGKQVIEYRAYPSEKPVITGGRRITGWKIDSKGRWVVEIPEVLDGLWDFRQLYVDEKRQRRARFPNEGFYTVKGFPDGGREAGYQTDSGRFQFAPGDLNPAWSNLEDVEVIVYHFWTDSHLPIKEIDTATNIVTFQHKAGKVFNDDFTDKGARYIVENVYEGLDQPGEWYLSRKTGVLTYSPLPGQDPRSTVVIAPFAPELVRLHGDPKAGEWVENLKFSNLTFRYTNFDLPPGNSNDRQGSASVPAAIVLNGARGCVFDHCTVTNLGTFAFEVGEGCTENRFTANRLEHIGAGGFRVNGGTEENHPSERTARNVIADNLLAGFGEEFPSAVGVLLMHTEGNLVSHNEIHYGWYTGVSIGWNWGYQRSISRDNVIEFNHLHHIGQGLLSDMGAVYTLGVSPGTVIRNNLIHDVEANQYGGWGIYNDEGSTHILVEDNVVYNTKFAGYDIHFCREVTVRNNVFALGRLQQLSRTRREPHKSVFFENNIVYWKGDAPLFDGQWDDKPYVFYFHPKDEKGQREETSTFDSDWNVYFNPGKAVTDVPFNKKSFEEWKAAGKDVHSLYADPLFVDPERYDFRLKPGSPALSLGIHSIDVSTVGPRVKPGAQPES